MRRVGTLRSDRIRPSAGTSIKSRIGGKSGGGGGGITTASLRSRRGRASAIGAQKQIVKAAIAAVTKSPVRDARQKINLNRIIKGRIGDARQKIETKRKVQPPMRFESPLSKVPTLKITTHNSPVKLSGGMFGLPVSGLHSSSYWPPSPPQQNTLINTKYSKINEPMGRVPVRTQLPIRRESEGIFQKASLSQLYFTPPTPPQVVERDEGMVRRSNVLSRTIANPTSSFSSSQSSSSVAKVRPTIGGNMSGVNMSYGNKNSDDEMMDVELGGVGRVRASLKARLDTPPKPWLIRISNLQPSVSQEDITELFADVGELMRAKIIGDGLAEVEYRSKNDCLKAIEAYHNRLLDGSPMKITLIEQGVSGVMSGLKSASGSTMKIPKSKSAAVKICPDISAIHKVLFQPTSSSVLTKSLFTRQE